MKHSFLTTPQENSLFKFKYPSLYYSIVSETVPQRDKSNIYIHICKKDSETKQLLQILNKIRFISKIPCFEIACVEMPQYTHFIDEFRHILRHYLVNIFAYYIEILLFHNFKIFKFIDGFNFLFVQVNYRLLDGVVSIFETHALEVKMNEADKETLQRSLEEGKIK